MKYCQLAIFPESEIEIEIEPEVKVNSERFYFPVIVNGSMSVHWTLALSELEAISMHTSSNPHRRIWIDSSTWGIKTEQGYLCCLIGD
ncbi:hypothetical protein [Pseudanabaena yagii]|uniref:Uncharacterized protein n=1 Tax=Pseudanabaena yagii GIHE-NHR1 TaxID=2722753 RepID=A0ABX1LP30_9CYAN|nr:hypothetical protein [Pseudanabaena yagii]NMF57097.1 hypothetical protein [Pseudanabaena yagii GIHE-NHR1]NMF57889.1 hypothetical protein [Pseudanabaena yagii GIHE-NHR1]